MYTCELGANSLTVQSYVSTNQQKWNILGKMGIVNSNWF